MAGDKFYIVRDPDMIEGSYDYFWKDYPTEKEQLAALCWGLSDGGYDSDSVVRIIYGGDYKLWKAEGAVLYSDEAAARADAKKRLAALVKKAKPKATKKASVPERVAARFKAQG